jgi:tRNA threonylcarbamoyladenosine biosynthesis protein TsaB
MKFLVIETSLEKSFVLLFIEGKTSIKELPDRKQRDLLFPVIDTLLKQELTSLSSLDFIGIGKGPGSFTGTRIGVLTAKTLSFANHIPLIPFLSPMIYTPPQTPSFSTVLSAKSHGFCLYDGKKVSLVSVPPKTETLYSPHPDKIPAKTTLVHPNFPHLINELKKTFKEGKLLFHSSLHPVYLHAP